jgi:hypothetical protein
MEVVSASPMLSFLPSRCPATAPRNFPFTTYSFALWGLKAGSTHGCATACILFNLISFINILSLAVVIHCCTVFTTWAILYCWYEKHTWFVYRYKFAKPHCHRQKQLILQREGKVSCQRARTHPYVSACFSCKSIRCQAILCRASNGTCCIFSSPQLNIRPHASLHIKPYVS